MPDQTTLACYHCGYDYTHITAVIVLARDEDEPGILTTIRTQTQGDMTTRPSTDGTWRRHTVTLRVFCENCKKTIDTRLVQHKGQTLVSHQFVQELHLVTAAPEGA